MKSVLCPACENFPLEENFHHAFNGSINMINFGVLTFQQRIDFSKFLESLLKTLFVPVRTNRTKVGLSPRQRFWRKIGWSETKASSHLKLFAFHEFQINRSDAVVANRVEICKVTHTHIRTGYCFHIRRIFNIKYFIRS